MPLLHLGISCYTGLWCSAQVSQLDRTIDCFSSVTACIVLPGTMEEILQEVDFQVRSTLNYSSPRFYVGGVFSNSGSPSTPERQSRATAYFHCFGSS